MNTVTPGVHRLPLPLPDQGLQAVNVYLLEEEPKLLQTLSKLTSLDLELRDDPMMRLDEFRLMSRPAGRDVTELYAVA